MSTFTPSDLRLNLTEPLTEKPDDGYALARYPWLREFRRELGWTPLPAVPGPDGGARILGKCESRNPFGSIKDRAAYALFCAAVAEHGDREEPLKLLDYSGGNFALALAGITTHTDVAVRFTLPSTTPESIRARLAADRAEVDLVDSAEFLYGIIARALAIADEEPGWTLLHQMRNMHNLAIHEFGTGAEIVRQLGDRRPSHLVGSIGTGGTLVGVGRALRRRFGDVALVGVTPAEMPYGTGQPPNGERKFAGGGGLGYGLCQPFVHTLTTGTGHRGVPYPRALEAMADFRDATGFAIGASAAASWLVAREIAAGLGEDDTVVAVFADAGTAEEWATIDGRAP